VPPLPRSDEGRKLLKREIEKGIEGEVQFATSTSFSAQDGGEEKGTDMLGGFLKSKARGGINSTFGAGGENAA